MKKSVKIILIVASVLILIGIYLGYMMYMMVAISEKISGNQGAVPEKTSSFPPLTKDSADWPNWRGIHFDGKSATKGIKTDWSQGLKILWQVDFLCQGNASASWSAPVIQGNRLVIPGRDEKNDLVFCLNTTDGSLIWKGSYQSEANTNHGPGSRATPFIDDDRVYTFGRSGDLVCWQLEDGKLLWKKSVKELGGEEPQWGHSTTPLVFKNSVIIQGGGESLVIAFDKISGNVLWKSMKGDAGYAATIPMFNENEWKLLVYHANGLACINSNDGKECWNVPWKTDYGVNATTPLVDNNIVFHSSGYKMGGQALEVTKTGYKVLWTNKGFNATHSDPVLIDGYIYGYSGDTYQNKGDFKCLEMSSGKEMWSTNMIGLGTTAYVDGYLICLDLKGNLFLIKPDPIAFQKVGEIPKAIPDVKNLAWTVPVIANDKLYLRYLQQLICFDLKP